MFERLFVPTIVKPLNDRIFLTRVTMRYVEALIVPKAVRENWDEVWREPGDPRVPAQKERLLRDVEMRRTAESDQLLMADVATSETTKELDIARRKGHTDCVHSLKNGIVADATAELVLESLQLGSEVPQDHGANLPGTD